ncbi:MAG: SURF1 family protein [Gemmatimonadota bacterium]
MVRRSRHVLFTLLLLLAALFTRLGFWQLSRLHARQVANAEALKGRNAPPVDLNTWRDEGGLTNRWVVARGHYDRSQEIVLRGHVYLEIPGVEVVTPFQIEGRDTAILVNRGFVPSPDAVTASLDTLNEPGTIQVQGLAAAIPVSNDRGGPLEAGGKLTYRRLDLAELRARIPYPILDVYLLQNPDSSLPRRPMRQEPPALTNGPHLSYAIQWFSFALIAIVGGWVLLFRRPRTSPPIQDRAFP